jgi:hypothetical protein
MGFVESPIGNVCKGERKMDIRVDGSDVFDASGSKIGYGDDGIVKLFLKNL